MHFGLDHNRSALVVQIQMQARNAREGLPATKYLFPNQPRIPQNPTPPKIALLNNDQQDRLRKLIVLSFPQNFKTNFRIR